jgi:hypothetical protein
MEGGRVENLEAGRRWFKGRGEVGRGCSYKCATVGAKPIGCARAWKHNKRGLQPLLATLFFAPDRHSARRQPTDRAERRARPPEANPVISPRGIPAPDFPVVQAGGRGPFRPSARRRKNLCNIIRKSFLL